MSSTGEEWFIIFNGYFWLSLTGILIGGLHLCLRYCERSRCKSCNLCNCIKFDKENDEPQQNQLNVLNRTKSNSTII